MKLNRLFAVIGIAVMSLAACQGEPLPPGSEFFGGD